MTTGHAGTHGPRKKTRPPLPSPESSVPRGTRGWYGDASGAFLIETPDEWNAHVAFLVFSGITSSSRIDRRDTGRFDLRPRPISALPVADQVRELQAALSARDSARVPGDLPEFGSGRIRRRRLDLVGAIASLDSGAIVGGNARGAGQAAADRRADRRSLDGAGTSCVASRATHTTHIKPPILPITACGTGPADVLPDEDGGGARRLRRHGFHPNLKQAQNRRTTELRPRKGAVCETEWPGHRCRRISPLPFLT